MSMEINEDFYTKIMQIVDSANQKQTQDLKREIDEVKEVVAEESKKRAELEKELEKLQEKHKKLEKAVIKNNVIIFGISIAEGEDILEKVIGFLNGHLDTALTSHDINDIYTIGKKQAKPIIVKFISYLKKAEVIKNSYKLKEYNKENKSKIYITHEQTTEEQEDSKILRQHMKQARNKCLAAYIRKGQLIIGEDSYTVQQLRGLEISSAEEGEESEKGQQKSNPDKGKSKISRKEEEEEESSNLSKKSKTAENRPRLPSSLRTRKTKDT